MLTRKNPWLAMVVLLGPVSLAGATAGRAPMAEDPAPARAFLFTYSARVTGLSPGQVARIWLPVPPSNEDQDVAIVRKDVPGKEVINREAKYGNEVLFVEARAGADGTIPVSVMYRVTRREVRAALRRPAAADEGATKFLLPDARVPVGGKPLALLKGKEVPPDQLEAARLLYDVVNGHMRYSKHGTGWGRGDAVWACDSGYGNCTDFHSLFISLARSQQIPAKFEIGFPLPTKHGAGEVAGYHCWAKFRPEGHGWVPVDISEANKDPKLRDYYFGHLTADRVTFSTGRDLELVPRQAGAPLNFLVYPYAEVDGKPYEKVQRKFTFEDVSPGEGR